MANPVWYNDNQFRDYPFVTRVKPLQDEVILDGRYGQDPLVLAWSLEDLPHGLIVDFGCLMGVEAEFDENSGHFVQLAAIQRSGNSFIIQFTTNAPGANLYSLFFERNIYSNEFKSDWMDSITGTVLPFDPLDCSNEAKWSGFLVTGNMEAFIELLPVNGTILFSRGPWQVLPSRIQNLRNSYLRSINLANTPRSTISDAAGCATNSNSSSSSSAAADLITNATCINGKIAFKAGYNCIIRQDSTRKQLTIGAGVGLGSGEPCEEIPLSSEELPLPGSTYLSGGPRCVDTIKTINGVGGRDLSLLAGAGYSIQPDPLIPHTLVVTRTLGDFAVCAVPTEESSSSSASAEASSSSSVASISSESTSL